MANVGHGRTQSNICDLPIFLVWTRGNIQHIAACCRAAQGAGVRPGMTLAQARAMVSGSAIHIEDLDGAAERAALKRLAEWASLRYSPLVSIDPCTLSEKINAEEPLPDGLLMDITGCERLFGGQQHLALSLMRSLTRSGFEASIGIAPTIGAAWAASRFGPAPVTIFDSTSLRAHLEPLPVRALRIEDDTEQALVELGIETIGQLLALPRSTLPSRFGPLLLRRIDQAFGQAIETIEPVRPRPPLRLERIFDGPTPQQEAIENCTRELLLELSRQLLRRESGVRLLEAIFERIGRNGRGTEPLTERITLSRPSRDARHLWSLLRPRIEKLHLGYGIESITLTALRTARLHHKQRRVDGKDGSAEERHQGTEASWQESDAGQLIDTLANRLGPDRVLRAEVVESHIPERSIRFITATHPFTNRRRGGRRESAPLGNLSQTRPTLLFDHPEPAEAIALSPDHPPTLLRWRGREHRIIAGFGPERIAGEWWTVPPNAGRRGDSGRCHPTDRPERQSAARDAWERDYFRLCDEDGRWLWVFRETPLYRMQDLPDTPAPVRWFIHGIWA
jgi:protein ImuB